MQNKIYAGGFLYIPQTEEVLLHKRDGNTRFNPNKWSFFGGTNEGPETPAQVLVREMEEELGLRLQEDELMPLCNYVNEELGTHRFIFYIESQKQKSEMILGEGEDFDWVPLTKVMDYDLTEKTVRDLKTFQEHLNQKTA